jgi:asparagine synthase (glutamine-hydrolysing)
MCGIVGALSRRGDQHVESTVVRRMIGAVRHRGPDQFGEYLFNDGPTRVALGSARLSIIDIAGGQQPLSNEDETLWIVFNGEIYNYIELRARLEREGHCFSSMSDTEVILHLYEEYGPDCLNWMNGQFAIAIWDEKSERLFLARDRCGVRPLFYTEFNGTLLFASEIKAILAYPGMAAELDLEAIDQIFTHWSPLAPRTAFAGIRSLPPGCWLLAAPDGPVRLQRYWQLSFPPDGEETLDNLDEAVRQFRELLLDAVRLRLRSEVPVGAYLSGGLDSSAITAMVHDICASRLETFSIGFTDRTFDETGFQTRMASFLGTRHHSISCSCEDIGRVFPSVIWHTEIPILRTAPAPLYLLSEMVHGQGFKVVLTGEGADEFLAGYDIFKECLIRRFWARQPKSAWRPTLLRKLYPYLDKLQTVGGAYQQRFFGQNFLDTENPTYSHDLRWQNTARVKRLFSPSVKAALLERRREPDGEMCERIELPPDFSRWSPLARAQYLEVKIFLAEYLLSSQGDRMAMAHSVEGRFPFLDHRIIELCSQLVSRFKLFGLKEKYLLKRIMRGVLPEEIVDRPKQPYRAPIQACFFPGGKPLDWVAEALSPAAVRKSGFFDAEMVTLLAKKSQSPRPLTEMDGMALVAVLSTQLVYRLFLTEFQAPAPVDEKDDVKTVIRCGDLAEKH